MVPDEMARSGARNLINATRHHHPAPLFQRKDLPEASEGPSGGDHQGGKGRGRPWPEMGERGGRQDSREAQGRGKDPHLSLRRQGKTPGAGRSRKGGLCQGDRG